MGASVLQSLIPGAPLPLCEILDETRGSVQPPIRSEIFGVQRFSQHGRSLGDTHRAASMPMLAATFFPRLKSNIHTLREAQHYIGVQAATGYDISPAAEWLLDNFHTIEAQIKEIHEGLPRSYFRTLPMLLDEPLAGLPRIYGVAWAFVAHTDGAFDEDLLVHFLRAYQETRELKLSEIWALPTTLRVVLVENLRRLAERVASNKAAREVANMCFDHIDSYNPAKLDQLLYVLTQRGVSQVFLAQMAQRQQDRRVMREDGTQDAVQAWLTNALPDLGATQIRQSAEQAADNLSVSNAVMSLRAIGDADWTDIVARTSSLMQCMLGAPLFAAEDVATRDQTLHAIEKLAQRSNLSELSVGQAVLGLMQAPDSANTSSATAHHWLRGGGQAVLRQTLGLPEQSFISWRHVADRSLFTAYLLVVTGALALLVWQLLTHAGQAAGPAWPTWLVWVGALALVFPASEAVVAVINRMISESLPPQHLSRLALVDGIPPEHRVLVVIPGMLTSAKTIHDLVHRLELHYLANPERHAQFALLSDWADASSQQLATDAQFLDLATELVRALNLRHPRATDETNTAGRFVVLHRERTFSEGEQRWMGWERKRGKLEQLLAVLARGSNGEFVDLGDAGELMPDTKYVFTLDSDTQLPPGRLRELVSVAAHPHNQPQLDASGRKVVSGYAIFQPRITTPLPIAKNATLYHWLFAGQCGIDPYSAASSEVYQDLFAEGTYTGKGLLHVQALHAVLAGRLPENLILSHDLVEGSIARCAAVSDITVIEEAPFHADVAASRMHRWIRGDWQLLPVLVDSLLHPKRDQIRAVNHWKMVDNLRRSLVAPMSLALVVLALAGVLVSPGWALALVYFSFSAGPLMGALAGFFPSRYDVAKRHFFGEAAIQLVRALLGGLWHVAQLLQQSLLVLDAIVRALYRTAISKRQLLQWTVAELAQTQAKGTLIAVARFHWIEPAIALLLLLGLYQLGAAHWALAVVVCLVWGASPVWTWWVSKAPCAQEDVVLPEQDSAYLEGIARDTWRFFERCVVAADNHLPPDNLQLSPHDMVAHRTSPTNIGLYLLSAACARKFGWIGTQDLLARLEATLATLLTLQRHRGHFLNWYDTQTCAPLMPQYVSTVDSGNLSGHLLALAQACLELAHAPLDDAPIQRALRVARQRMAPLLASRTSLPTPMRKALQWQLADHRNTRKSCAQDARASTVVNAAGQRVGSEQAAQRLRALAHAYTQMAWQADFSFLYHRKRHLFHIGYRVAEQQKDAGFYDLMASESRLTSLLAIAKGDVPVRHWASLGRPFFAVGTSVGLRSWTGSMFEYLMPSLVLDEPPQSVLRAACNAALREHMAFAKMQNVPWGISESAYAASDDTLAYQYAPQGVPRLALRRTPPDELVVAPYATALAAVVDPEHAVQNFRMLEALGARARYGFIEALDYTPSRVASKQLFAPVDTIMAHHQGMSIVALAHVLMGGPARRWTMANAPIEAVASLLHERVPREVSLLYAPPAQAHTIARQRRRGPGLLREVTPGYAALEPTHLLSNGRYHVSLRSNGAGESRWGQTGITRQRDDALQDAYGSFFYVRWNQQPHWVSLTQHPAPDPSAHYQSAFHPDRVCFETTWSELQTHMTVWVSPEDDIELRTVELRNLSDQVLEVELVSAFELTLTEAKADEAHPAFTSMFVKAQWLAAQQALWFERTPRLATEPALQLVHFLATDDDRVLDVRIQTDRQRWLGRNRAGAQPLASLDAVPAAAPAAPTPGAESVVQSTALVTGLDPVCALAVRLSIAPGAKIELTFATTVSDNGGTLSAVIDKYRQHNSVKRSSLMSATLAGIRLRALRISAENFAAMQTLTTALVLSVTRVQTGPAGQDGASAQACDRRLLWRFSISGERPLMVVSVADLQGLGLLRAMAQALNLWAWAGLACDLVVVNSEPASYAMDLHRAIEVLRERHAKDTSARSGPAMTGFHMLRADELSAPEWSTLKAHARFRFHADGRPLAHHVNEWIALHEKAFDARGENSSARMPASRPGPAAMSVPKGEFINGGAEFQFQVNAHVRPIRPWINVLSNPQFGAQITEAGGGYTWAVNSRLNQLTAWSNDPVCDPPAEWFLLQDTKTLKVWSVAPNAWGDASASYQVSHGQGYTRMSHQHDQLEVTATWCVDAKTSVKQIQISLVNHGQKTLHLRVIGIAQWMMGANRSDRATVLTSYYQPALGDLSAGEHTLHGLLCTQQECSAGFGDGTAFFSLAVDSGEETDWTCDRRECFDANGQLTIPDYFDQRAGVGLDPCAALSCRIALAPGKALERVFLLGYASSPSDAQQLCTQVAAIPSDERMQEVRSTWDQLLGATQVKTPDPLFDALLNRWLLYQAVTCRLWAKSAFYQAGGATGFRDQLQDAMALGWAAPHMLRQQIVLCASRQFEQGDVQHWWHAPLGAGVRTHFSDDLLWLPFACIHYLRATADLALLDQRVSFIEGPQISPGAEDAYYTPQISAVDASIYEHAALAIDRSLRVGVHGLPLMGTGDWNDGMNQVGVLGQGESVWLAWFLCQLVTDFVPIAHSRGDSARAHAWSAAHKGWTAALNGVAWDGQWFTRAFFDNGQALGSHANAEARIDLIAQAWAVLSNATTPARQRQAMQAADAHLVDPTNGLIKLLAPPLQDAMPSAGYIQAYPPGVRENGGQYSHAGIWALMAAAELSKTTTHPGEPPDNRDDAYRYFTYLSPAHRSAHPAWGASYGLEPYVMAADVYSQAPYVGRGGWSWYTGAAAWMHRAGIESIFGLQLGASELTFNPCMPSHWPQAELSLVRGAHTMRFIVMHAGLHQALAATSAWHAQPLYPGQVLQWTGLPSESCFVIPLLMD